MVFGINTYEYLVIIQNSLSISISLYVYIICYHLYCITVFSIQCISICSTDILHIFPHPASGSQDSKDGLNASTSGTDGEKPPLMPEETGKSKVASWLTSQGLKKVRREVMKQASPLIKPNSVHAFTISMIVVPHRNLK